MKIILGALVITSTIVTNSTSLTFINRQQQRRSLEEICQVNDNSSVSENSRLTSDLANIVKQNLKLDNTFDNIIKRCALYLNQKDILVSNKKQKIEQTAHLEIDKFANIFDVKNFIRNDVLSRSINYLVNQQITLNDTKRSIVHLLMQLKLVYGDKFINQGLNQINWLNSTNYGAAGFFSVNLNPYVTALTLLYKDVFSVDYIEQSYNTYMATMVSDIYVLTHEYGHALSIYAGLTKWQKNNINKHNKVIDAKPLSDRDINSTIIMKNNASNRLAQWLEQHFNFNSVQDKKIMLSLMVPSKYGQPVWENKLFEQDASFIEWFAELFTYWMLTPKQDYSVRWQIINEFFINTLPRII